MSPFLREKEARFLVEVERAAGSFKVLQPEDTDLVCDPSPTDERLSDTFASPCA